MEDLDEMYKCMVCFDLCCGAIECLACHKLMCVQHVKSLNQTCPNSSCRASPFKCQSNVPIQNMIEQIRRKLPIKCCVQQCIFEGDQDPFIQHAVQEHPEQIIHICTNSQHDLLELRERRKQSISQLTKLQKLYDALCEKDQPQLKKEAPKKKAPTSEQLQAMKQHITNCNQIKCFKIWDGRWGLFIGGKLGSTHFDLTTCADGKKLNENIGWDYENPDK